MNKVELYYEVKALFNTSQEAFEIFYEYKAREHKDFTNILCICVSRNESQRFFRKAVENTASKNYDANKKEIYYKDKTITFKSIEEIEDKKEFTGRIYNSIKFLS